MTTVDETPGTAESRGGAVQTDAASTDQGRRWYVVEGLLMVELGGLAAFAFGRPVLDTFGRSPETFVARGADALTIVLFGLVVALGPCVALGLFGLLGRPFGPTVRCRAHVVLVAVVGGLAVWQLGQSITGYPPESQKLAVAGVIGGLAVGYLRASVGSLATFLRFAGVASVIFLVQFLFLSPTSGLVIGDGPSLDDDVGRRVAADLGDDPPDVAVLVFDALPTVSLLDGTGRIDAELFPNFARLAATSSWYRNNTTVASFTGQAVPAILTGRFRPEGADDGRLAAHDDENLFTLLGGSYEMHVAEQITRLCPSEVCTDAPSHGLTALLGDAVDSWAGRTSGGDESGELDLPGALEPSRYAEAEEWEESQIPRDPDRPQFRFHHMILPHSAWVTTDDGDLYRGVARRPTGSFGMGWTDTGVALGSQRHILQLQAADRLLGGVLDGLAAEGRFDDSMIVVTADHGNAFITGEPERGLSEGNMEQIMWTPLLVKAPAQTTPVVDDSNVMSIDIVPTIAEQLRVEMPWEVDGIPVGEAAAERDDTKLFQFNKNNWLRPSDGQRVFEIEDTRERFERVVASDMVEGRGPDGAWRRTAHGGLFGLEVEALDVGAAADGAISVERLRAIEGSDRDEPLAEVVGHVQLPQGTVVAYALNGTIAAVTEVEPPLSNDRGAALGLVPARLFRDGGNELTAYVVEGPVGAETLRPIDVAEAE